MTGRYLEEFAPGQKFASGQLKVDREGIKSFAAEFDPQPFHLNEEAARGSIFKDLAASGWHTAAMTMRLLVESEEARGWHRRRRIRRISLAEPRTTGRYLAPRPRSARGTAFQVTPRSRCHQGKDHDAESEQ
jgi:hypothetical protein